VGNQFWDATRRRSQKSSCRRGRRGIRWLSLVSGFLLSGCIIQPGAIPGARPSSGSPPDPVTNCRNQVAIEFETVPMADISVYPAPADVQGNAIANWRTRNGGSGFCRINPAGQVIGFVVENQNPPTPTPTQPIRPTPAPTVTNDQLRSCKSRVGVEFANLPMSSINVYPDRIDSQGTAAIAWETRSRAYGSCRVDTSNNLREFRVDSWGDRPVSPTPPPVVNNLVCAGPLRDLSFIVNYDGRIHAFTRIEFWRQQGRQFIADARLSYAGRDNQGRDIYRGAVAAMAEVVVVDLSNFGVRPGSEISVKYDGSWGRGTCR